VSNAGSREELPDLIDRQRAEVAQVRRSRRRLLEAAFADRRAVESALHDGVQQRLVALAVDLQRLARLLDGDPAAARALVAEMATNIQSALDETSELARWVYPPLLEGRGLATALRSAAESAGVTAVVDVPSVAGFAPEITAAVYWTCVDALSSASRGSQATVSVRDADGGLSFEVAVIGRHSTEQLDRLRDRIEALDGRLSVEEHEVGSRVHGWLPLSR
jgi:signal transduction histidine kinase